MVKGGRVEITVLFDNVFEADGWLRKEYRGFRKDAVLIFRFSSSGNVSGALKYFSHSFVIGDKFYVPMGVVNEKFFLDDACDIIDKAKEFGAIIIEVEVTATKEANNEQDLDGLFNDVRREIELWNFSRAMDSLPKARV